MIAKDLIPIPGSGAYLGTVTLPGLREPARAPHKHHWPLLCCPPGGRWPPGYRLGYPGGHRPRYQPVRLPRSTRNMSQSPEWGQDPSRSCTRWRDEQQVRLTRPTRSPMRRSFMIAGSSGSYATVSARDHDLAGQPTWNPARPSARPVMPSAKPASAQRQAAHCQAAQRRARSRPAPALSRPGWWFRPKRRNRPGCPPSRPT